ncbi:undecaprenyl-diphosphate phosphatase [Saezia sanguinis]|uniref:undecaprenyl-diphosphate phosphatase n=1 Tax=Saezia sanguinis TaxID=1965230 RepID=UPI0030DA0C11
MGAQTAKHKQGVAVISWWEALILGLVQGLTEFLPISSSAHLRILGTFLPSATDPGAAFTAITQIGTELAVLVYFRHDIWRLLMAWCASLAGRRSFQDSDVRVSWLVIIGSIPICVLGLLFRHAIETYLRNLYITATMLIVFAILLGIADRIGSKKRPLKELGWTQGILYGLAQALALMPGVSRSGGTITAGLLMGFTREAAARYSFLLAIPAVLASGFYQLYASWGEAGPVSGSATALATVVAFVVGYGVIVAFIRLVSHYSYMPFVWYRLALGALVFVLLACGVIAPL